MEGHLRATLLQLPQPASLPVVHVRELAETWANGPSFPEFAGLPSHEGHEDTVVRRGEQGLDEKLRRRWWWWRWWWRRWRRRITSGSLERSCYFRIAPQSSDTILYTNVFRIGRVVGISMNIVIMLLLLLLFGLGGGS